MMDVIVLPGSHDAKYVSPYDEPGTAHLVYDADCTGSVLERVVRFAITDVGIHAVDVGGPHVTAAAAAPVKMVAPPCALADSGVDASFTTVPAASSVGSIGFSESMTRPDGVSTMSVERQSPKSRRKRTEGTFDGGVTVGSPRKSSVFAAAPQFV